MKKLIFIHVVFVCLTGLSVTDVAGQADLRDSLRNRLESADDWEKIRIYNELSRIHLSISLVAAHEFAENALSLSEELGDKQGKADALNRKGNVYFYFADFDSSLNYYLESLALREELNDQRGIAGSYSNIALIYSAFGKHDQAVDFTLKSYNTFREIGDKNSEAVCLNNLTYLYMEANQYIKALDYGLKTLELFEELGDPAGISDALNNLGDIYRLSKMYDQALSYHLRSLNINKELNDPSRIANSKYNISQLYYEISQYDQGIQYLNEGLPLALELQSKELIKDMYSLLATYHETLGDFSKAFEYSKLYTQVNDSIFNQESRDRIATTQVKFETERKSREIQLLKKDKEIRFLERRKQKNMINFLIVFSILILVLGIFGFNSYKVKKETNELLQDQNIRYYYANRKLSRSEKDLRDLNTTKDKFFSIIGHDLINPFQALLGLAELLHDYSEEIEKEEIEKYSQLINQSAKNLYNLLENLLQWTRSQTGKLIFNPEELRLTEQVSSVISLMKPSAEKKHIHLVSEIEENILILTDKNILETVLRNLVSNAIKYTCSGGLVRIRARTIQDQVQIVVADTGTGISEEDQKKLFNVEKTFSTKGTSKEEGSGLGLILCKEFIEINGGEIGVDSIPGHGSNFIFTVPRII